MTNRIGHIVLFAAPMSGKTRAIQRWLQTAPDAVRDAVMVYEAHPRAGMNPGGLTIRHRGPGCGAALAGLKAASIDLGLKWWSGDPVDIGTLTPADIKSLTHIDRRTKAHQPELKHRPTRQQKNRAEGVT